MTEVVRNGLLQFGGSIGGIRHQIEDSVNEFLVESVEQIAERIVLQALKQTKLTYRFRHRAWETVRRRFLIMRLMKDWFDLISDFEIGARIKGIAH